MSTAFTRWLATAAAVVSLLLIPSVAMAHSLDSSTISVRVTDETVEATISFAVETLDEALGTDYLNETELDGYTDEIIAYIDEHLTVTSTDGSVWDETYSNPVRETVEGIKSFSVDVAFDVGASNSRDFTIAYDAIVEEISDHEAVIILTDTNDDVSSPGIITHSSGTVQISGASKKVAAGDMIAYGFEHVLEGADHLLFLTVLLLPAPLVVLAGRWGPGAGSLRTLRKVVHVITAFTIGHSIALIAAALGWVTLPSQAVEILIAVSVGVSAVHAIRPLAAHGEEMIAAGFGLVHGLAFAGILTDLGIEGSTSLLALLTFNIGIELSQLLTAALIFPSLYVMSRTRYYGLLRVAGASLALAMAVGWVVDRIGVVDNPFDALEVAAIDHPWRVVIGLAIVAFACFSVDRRTYCRRYGLPTG